MTYHDLLRVGGSWLGAARSWMQRNFRNGSIVIWGGSEILEPYVRTLQVEEVAACAVAAYINEDSKRGDLIRAANFAVQYLQGKFDDDLEVNKHLALIRLQGALKRIDEGGLS